MSLGGGGACSASSAMQVAITGAVSRGVTVVVAAGHSSADASGFQPASCANVINVGATTSAGVRASFSNYGSLVDVAAPGQTI
ncbi:S8 family serine peptidase, partial [Streptococcus salivarius]|nr:S8 family serine peptidase [Streptococcus salivarius]